jgi:glycosyltransferase involved in cell wall biosynthesis
MFSASFRAADLVHIPFPAVPPVKQPLVVSVFDAGFALFPEAYTARGRHFHARALSLVARRADAVLTATHAAAAEIAAFSPVPAHLLRVVPLGVDHRRPGPGQVQEALARLGLHGAPYVLWVGSLEPRKGLGTLVKAFAKLAKAGAFPHRLVLAGPAGWLHEGLIDDADKLALGDRLRAVGPVSESDLVSLYAGASVFAFPSWHEGFGLPVLEAMAQGTPVVCSDIASLAEVSGGAARLVPPGEVDLWADALGELVGDESARTTLAAAGTERASGYTWETTARLAHEIYQELT